MVYDILIERYFSEINRSPLLNPDEEKDLSRRLRALHYSPTTVLKYWKRAGMIAS